MAIYHISMSVGSRSAENSAGAKFDYIAREGKYAEDDPDSEREVVRVEHANMPRWATADPTSPESEKTQATRRYWAAADQHERSNGRLYRQLVIALPAELSPDDQWDLASGFAQHLTAAEKLPYTLAIHRQGSGNNPHAHLMISERINDGIDRPPDRWFRRAVAKPKPPEDGETPRPAKDPAAGGARKSRSMMPHDWLEQTREDWADQVNAALERRDFPARVDHRSWATRALEAFELGDIDTAIALSREPNPHIGTAVPAMTLKRAIVGDLEPLYLAERAQDIEALNDQLVVEWDAVNDDIARGEAELQELENQLQTIRAAAAELELAVERDERDRQRGGKGR